MVIIHQIADSTQRIIKALNKIGIQFQTLEEILLSKPKFDQIFEKVKQFDDTLFSYQRETLPHRTLTDRTHFYMLLAGAMGEQRVIQELEQLDDRYYLMNGMVIALPRSKFWYKGNQYVRSATLDHLLLGPEGLFLLETKNWSLSTIINDALDPFFQVNRMVFLFNKIFPPAYLLNTKIRPVVVSINNPIIKKNFKIDHVMVKDLVPYIHKHRKYLQKKKIQDIYSLLLHTPKNKDSDSTGDLYI
jgi:hypothetical protein